MHAILAANQIEWPKARKWTDRNTATPISRSSCKDMLLTFSEAWAVHACEDEISQQVLIETLRVSFLHFLDKPEHLLHVAGKEKIAIGHRVHLSGIPRKLLWNWVNMQPSSMSTLAYLVECADQALECALEAVDAEWRLLLVRREDQEGVTRQNCDQLTR